jgi:predicted DNA-binding antitoxin AbrB/MazE fold protein
MTNETIQAIYRDGAFMPLTPCNLPENSAVELVVRESMTQAPAIGDAVERQRKIKEIAESMLQNPWPANAPHFSRSELHERR